MRSREVAGGGPGGLSGVLVADNASAPAAALMYRPGDPGQRWERLEVGGAVCWLGWSVDDLPSPGVLERRELSAGHRVTLADGHDWLIPVARSIDGGTWLPEVLTLEADGTTGRRVVGHLEAFHKHGQVLWEMFNGWLGGGGPEGAEVEVEGFDEADAAALAVDALSVNYRVGRAEVNALGLLTTANIWQVLQSVIDMPTWRRLVEEQVEESKKNGAAGGRTPPAAVCGAGG